MKTVKVKDNNRTVEQLIELLKELPQSKQEYINGYIQGVADAVKEQNKPA